jgi:trimeric autotransporter adhesin
LYRTSIASLPGIVAVASCLLGAAAIAAESPAPGIGVVFQTEFNGALGRLNRNERQLLYTKPVYLNEVVHTGKHSSTALLFLDKTRLQVGASSDLVLDRYVYDPGSNIGSVAVTFSSGIFRFVTGKMKNKDGYDLRTPSGTMAIRGTKLIVYVDEKGNTITYVEVGEGTATSCGGTSDDVRAGQSAVVPVDCSGVTVVQGNLTPPDPAVVADLPVPQELALEDLEPEAGPETSPPAEHDAKDHASPF